ncbi:UDP-N-acetylmuramate dehydrogenase [Porphyromonas circumdentaria]|uniref:UDP-N-acetylenolpyruvoylglucosamine reductase n=1 Tax=Porphyromonas circumdentaria TaxID=29524 RepID=A0A1T4KF58_9PORP|nr:UDP-N-acetylmuramate dehydrogenase [Porphyromonas circumdentaria]MBB6275073.1 UDP-N-acetylmuramate dehydrogenase [Porphyromonas circumdentaria]MDO4722891.1 UDP-N-acetylmuramate dehydrogenase [Porphyromonas circumdentaria]SJZ41072.1 UDP-N-acetylmuramate dehydrogenase [Porphyromonas circumdentaria]
MNIREKESLISHNTFKVSAVADWWIEYSSLEDLKRLSQDEYFQTQQFLPIGQGSNLLFLHDYQGVILSSQIKEIDIINESESKVSLRVGSGVIWDDLIVWALEHGYNGIENLSWIPGTVGAAAVQNIGAYGAEIEEFIDYVDTFDLKEGKQHTFTRAECNYGYRYSLFKEEEYKHHVITHVHFTLPKNNHVNLSYQALEAYFSHQAPTPLAVREAVIEIRKSKLPNPEKLPNAGSYFMNPIVPIEVYEKLSKEYSDMPYYPAEKGIKLSAAWLLDQAGLKGYKKGNIGTYERQPLIIVNLGKAEGAEIAQFAEELSNKVFDKFAIRLTPEVRYIGKFKQDMTE